ncbi:Tab2 family RNA-binding protein [Crocosphaera sp. UHCC 0190]|uniref:Tab2/Atab2 family RNA-binding protein n=1 Tax=Crocosphaera sp. UHCC 0190 TaxID=3110246 RepID=UPI002B217027|nr:Tab2 family RNA-binding protein [Crocosphaera sp. UHCC 0190]MEA5510671.1 Tab2 family RNA-binding protein [Crocosphaera sp. UHCC 0190]
MRIWQADFYKHSLNDRDNSSQWELIICDSQGQIIHEATCQQSEANSTWLINQLRSIIEQYNPNLIQVFRPQSLSLLTLAGAALNIKVEPNRRTDQLKEILKKRHPNAIKLEQFPPQALPENLWGDQWHFASFKAGDIIDFFGDRPIPILDFPDSLKPINLGIPSQINIPGVVIYGGRKSMYLARWLAENKPVALTYIPTEIGKSGGLILDAGLIDRWVLLTFEDLQMAKAAQQYEQQLQTLKELKPLTILEKVAK